MQIEMIMTAIISSIIATLTVLYSTSKFLNKKSKLFTLNNLILVLIYLLFLTINYYTTDKMLKTLFNYIILVVLVKNLFKEDWNKAIFSSIFTYLIVLLSELIVAVIVIFVNNIFKIEMINLLDNSIIANLMILLPTILIAYLFKKRIYKVVNFISNNNRFSIIMIFFMIMLVLSFMLNKLYLGNWLFTHDFYIQCLIMIIIFIIICAVIMQTKKTNNFFDKYKELAEYSHLTDKVLEEYRVKMHEYKNQLAIIKSLTPKNNIELNEYIDSLINTTKINSYPWINQIKYITLSELKGLINFKLDEMKNSNLKVNVIVSKDLLNADFESLKIKEKQKLYSLIGVYLDNSKDAAIDSKQKIVNIDISYSNSVVKVVITNTYKGTIEESKLDMYKYTTKGKEHGIGLYLANKIVEESNIFIAKRDISDKYFTQTLYIKVKEKN